MSNLKNKFLYAAIFVLTFAYFFSFCNANKDKREKIQTALINPNYKEKIEFFEFYDGENQKISLVKNDDFWEIQKKYGNFTQKMPANSQKIKKFLNESAKVVNMYKISDSYEENEAFMILKPGFIRLKYGFEDNYYEIFFGNKDFSLSSRYFATGKSTSVYEISDYLENFLTVSAQFWADPLLISSEIFGKIGVSDIQRNYAKIDGKFSAISDLQKLLDLRHGGFFDVENKIGENSEIFQLLNENEKSNLKTEGETNSRAESKNQHTSTQTSEYENLRDNQKSEFETELKLKFQAELSEIFLELGNKNSIKLEFFKESENSQIAVKSSYSAADKRNFVFNSKISLWTYNKIKEITL